MVVVLFFQVPGQVADDASRPAGAPTWRRRPAQHGPDPRRELPRRERLGHVVIGAQLEPGDAIGFLASGGEHDHRNGRDGAEPAAELQAAQRGQHQVQDDQVRRVGQRPVEAHGAVVDPLDPVALTLQIAGHDLRDVRVVFDDRAPVAAVVVTCITLP